jgi:transcriptional regulator
MYLPAHFEESRPQVLHELIARHPLGVLITHGEGGLDANHMPFEIDAAAGSQGVLRAHVARANPVWRELRDGDEVLVVFRAEHGYISPNWYPSKHELHKSVPTWNYMVAHAHGKVAVRDDERFVRGLVARLTRTHEASQPVPWKMTDSAPEFIDSMLQAIVGLEVEITRLVGKFKLGQNREARDLEGAGKALVAQGDTVLGQAMLACAAAKG